MTTMGTIIDEASLGVFFYEMFKAYLEGPGNLPDVAIHYSDFSDWFLKTSEPFAAFFAAYNVLLHKTLGNRRSRSEPRSLNKTYRC